MSRRFFRRNIEDGNGPDRVVVRSRVIAILEGALKHGRIKAAATEQATKILEGCIKKQAEQLPLVEVRHSCACMGSQCLS
jgi:hypothetical protein